MALQDDAEKLMRRAGDGVNDILGGDMASMADAFILSSIQRNVYDAYTPHGTRKYVRRMENGGLADARKYTHQVDGATHTLTVTDNRPEVAVVETGDGYTWLDADATHIQNYPDGARARPYFDDAESMLEADSMVDEVLTALLALKVP